MGVPKFFRYISERYPCLSELVKEHQIPEFDNLYLDMNGIIHMCSHPDDFDPHFRISEEKIFADIFHYIEVLFRMIKPQRLFFMAVDGVAPRAKMNQQRGRRFRSAKDAETLEAKAREKGELLPTEARFDSNCITPGTVFMVRLQEQLKYFVSKKISTDKLWQKCKIILSGHETPGEGEHKIMDYIRYMKSQPSYDPNTRHCLYGLDADLIMLGLCTHEPHFSLLREEVRFGRKARRKNSPEQITFYLLHLSLMREYLELEFLPLKKSLPFEYDMEKIIDDWVLMGFLVGNDFIPHLPNLHINNGALPILYNAYMKILPNLDGYINEAGTLNLGRFEKFMSALATVDKEHFSEQYADLKYFQQKTGRRPNSKQRTNYKLKDEWLSDNLKPFFEDDELLEPKTTNKELEALIKSTDDMLLEPSDTWNLGNLEPEPTDNGIGTKSDNKELGQLIKNTDIELLANFLSTKLTDNYSADPGELLSNSALLKEAGRELYESTSDKNSEIGTLVEIENNDIETPAVVSKSKPKNMLVEPSESNLEDLSLNDLHDDDEDDAVSNYYSESDTDDDLMNAEFLQHKTDYYMNKLDYSKVTPEVMRAQAEGYVRAIQWNLNYYYNGVCSWSWFYPHHYAPYISDIKDFANLKLEFELGVPFKPFEQLLGVLPSASKSLLPEAYQELMVSEESSILMYYPLDFRTDLNGKKQEWEAVVLIPFIAENKLLQAMGPCNKKLTEEEKNRNSHGPMLIYEYTPVNLGTYCAPEYFPTIHVNHAKFTTVTIEEIRVPIDKLVKGPCEGAIHDVYYPGFPSFKHLKYTGYLEKAKVRVFDTPSQNENMIIKIKNEQTFTVEQEASELIGKTVHVAWPHLVEALVMSVSDPFVRYKNCGANKPPEEIKSISNTVWITQRNSSISTHRERLGIEVGETTVLIHVKVLIGQKYVYTQRGQITLERQWSNVETVYPMQAVVKELDVHNVVRNKYETIQELYPMGSKCFMLGQPHYGTIGEVVENTSLKGGRLKISMHVHAEPDLSSIYKFEQEVKYMPGGIIAQRLAISPHLLSRITGSVFVVIGEKGEVLPRSSNKINVGLNLKYNKKNEEIPGYSKRVDGQWLYSLKALQLVSQYMTVCPELFAYISAHLGNDIFYESELFPEDVGTGRVHKIAEWLRKHPYSLIERRKIGSKTIDQELIQKIEEAVDDFYSQRSQGKQVLMQVKPHLLFKPEVQTSHLAADYSVTFNLYDRVVNVRESYTVPFGLKGTVVGILTDRKELGSNGDDLEESFDIIFDKPFAGAMQLNSCSNRGYRLPKSALINISHGLRLVEERTLNSAVSNAWFGRNPPISQQVNNQPVQSQNSAFASWYPPNMGYNPHASPSFAPPQMHQMPNTPVFGPPINHYQNRMPNIRPQQQLQGTTAEFHAFFNDLQKNQAKPSVLNPMLNMQQVAPNAPAVTVMPSSQVAQNVQVHKSIVPPKPAATSVKQVTPDTTAVLKKLLNISEKSKHQPPQKSQTQPMSVQDFFAHARNKEQNVAQSSKPVSHYSVQLLTYCQAQRIGIPRYTYMNFENGICAQINLPDGRMVIGNESPNKEEAAENAAKRIMQDITQNQRSVPINQPNYSNQLHSTPKAAASVFPVPPKQWWQSQMQKQQRNDKPNVKNNAYSKPQPNSKVQNGPTASTKQEISTEEMKLMPATPFVPLQAVKKQRSKSGSSSLDVENHTKSVSPAKNSCTNNSPSKNKSNDDSIKPTVRSQSSTNAPPQRRVRKSRVAANFSALQQD